mmetsp:Transcript_254/g.242  ORF Transcript_254/g.242 Transcript_254/m.242 type:complete len:211 (+) Transcript_254:609-1241(+)
MVVIWLLIVLNAHNRVVQHCELGCIRQPSADLRAVHAVLAQTEEHELAPLLALLLAQRQGLAEAEGLVAPDHPLALQQVDDRVEQGLDVMLSCWVIHLQAVDRCELVAPSELRQPMLGHVASFVVEVLHADAEVDQDELVQAVVCTLDSFVDICGVEQNVLRLDVAVDVPSGVHHFEDSKNLLTHRDYQIGVRFDVAEFTSTCSRFCRAG